MFVVKFVVFVLVAFALFLFSLLLLLGVYFYEELGESVMWVMREDNCVGVVDFGSKVSFKFR